MSRLPHFTCQLLWHALALALLSAAGRAQTETVLYNFSQSGDGYFPFGSLVADSFGNYYGTTNAGGLVSGQCFRQGFADPGCGTVFEISPDGSGGWTLKTLYQFKGQPDGAAPFSNLVLDSQGNLYGTTEYGGNGGQGCDQQGLLGCGTVFRLSPTTSGEWTESVIYDSQWPVSERHSPHHWYRTRWEIFTVHSAPMAAPASAHVDTSSNLLPGVQAVGCSR